MTKPTIPPPPPPPSQSQPAGATRRAAIPPPSGAVQPPVHPGGLVPESAPEKRYWKDPNATPRDPNAPTPQSGPCALTSEDVKAGFEPRDGDVLVVHYGAVKVPLPSGKFGSVEVGGESYTRQLRAGDDVVEQYEKVYDFLKGRSERAAREKVKEWYAQFSKGEGSSK